MLCVAVRGYGIIIWRDPASWKTYGRSDALAARLASRAGLVLSMAEGESHDAARDALLTLDDSWLLVDDTYGDEDELNLN